MQEYTKNYGGRGIDICKEWRESYIAFRDWALSNGYQDDLTLERNEVNGNYCPENCSWITKHAQSVNKRNTNYVEAWGERKAIALWAKDPRCVMSLSALRLRLKRGWRPEEAISTPAVKKRAIAKPA